jgi:hypothetical protein
MAWQNIEERLKAAFKVHIAFPRGSVWLPETHLTIDEWLTSLVQTDEELEGLNIRRIRFLENRWPLEDLIEFSCGDSSARRAVWAMSVGRRAYVLFYDGVDYHLIAAIEPKTNAALYRAVIRKLFQNPSFVSAHPLLIKNYRPDLISEIPDSHDEFRLDRDNTGQASEWINSASQFEKDKRSDFSKLFVGWVGKWIDVPVVGYWHEDLLDSVSSSTKENTS